MGPVHLGGGGTHFCPFCPNHESIPESPPTLKILLSGGGGIRGVSFLLFLCPRAQNYILLSHYWGIGVHGDILGIVLYPYLMAYSTKSANDIHVHARHKYAQDYTTITIHGALKDFIKSCLCYTRNSGYPQHKWTVFVTSAPTPWKHREAWSMP